MYTTLGADIVQYVVQRYDNLPGLVFKAEKRFQSYLRFTSSILEPASVRERRFDYRGDCFLPVKQFQAELTSDWRKECEVEGF